MADDLKKNLEPIEESDLDLKSKIQGGKIESANDLLLKKELPSDPERLAERKEGVAEKDGAYSNVLSGTPKNATKTVSSDEVKKDAEAVSKEQDSEGKISTLIKIAESKGVVHAVKVAKHHDDNYVIDELHDRLVEDDLRKALVEKGLVKEL